jgi:hypothetical protein
MPLSVEQGFEAFHKKLVPLPGEHAKAISHKGSVHSCMENNYGCTKFFETGSFGNGTGVRQYSDTDYFAVCDAKKLANGSGYALNKIKESLQYTFHSTQGIGVNTPAVRLQFGQHASETLEVTPAAFAGIVDTPLGKKASYWIPDYENGWMSSSPDAHNAYVRRENDRLGGMVKSLIQFVKAWKFYLDVPIVSFYLELRVTKYCETEKVIRYDEDISRFFDWLEKNGLPNMQDPMGISGLVHPCTTDAKKEIALSRLATAASRARKAVEFKTSNPSEAFRYWDYIFDNKFPAR